MLHFKAFGMETLRYEIRIWQKFLVKQQMTKTSQDNNLNYIHFLKNFYEYHTKRIMDRYGTCLILNVLP